MRRVCVCDISEIWRLVKMEKWCLRSLYMGSWNEWGLSRPTALGENPSVGFALHRWMYETARRLEHLIALCETRSAGASLRRVKYPLPHVWIEESCGLMSWKSKPCFFPFYKKEKSKFWGAIMGTKAQVGILGLGSYLVMWIRPRRSKWLEMPHNGGSCKGRVEG